MAELELPGGFPLADPIPAPVMITRPCGCTSMVTEDGAMPIQVSWCDEHDPGNEDGPPAADQPWACPDHGQPYDEYKRTEGWQEYWGCPVKGCGRGRWVS